MGIWPSSSVSKSDVCFQSPQVLCSFTESNCQLSSAKFFNLGRVSGVSFNTCLNLSFSSCQASIYGKRSGCLRGLAVLHRDKANVFRSSQGWKHAVIHQVQMLPRNGMYKPDAARQHRIIVCYPRNFVSQEILSPKIFLTQVVLPKRMFADRTTFEAQSALPHMGRAFTDAQELRQETHSCLWGSCFVFCFFPTNDCKPGSCSFPFLFSWVVQGFWWLWFCSQNHGQLQASNSKHLSHRWPSWLRLLAGPCSFRGLRCSSWDDVGTILWWRLW